MKILETERLTLNKVTLEDAPFLYDLFNSPGWLKYIGDRGIKTIKDAEQYIRDKIFPNYEKPGVAGFAVRLKKTNLALGMCGLYKREGLEDIDIGFAFLPEAAGKGYAYESAVTVLNYAKTTQALKRVVAITLPSNLRSIRLLEKIGLSFEKRIFLPNDPEELSLYSIEF